jgi:large subunit ribosomal protein L3
MKAIIGRKVGMTQLFTEDGAVVAVTVIEAGPCPVVQIKTNDSDGYDAVQLAYRASKEKHVNRPERGHLAKAGVAPHRHLREFRGATDLTVGDTVTVEAFGPGDHIKITGKSRGKGFAGTVKRHNFGRGPVTHGSHNVRKPGSIGQSAWPSRVWKGLRMSGHMGDAQITQRGLVVVDRDPAKNLLLVSGSVPGAPGTLLYVREDH